MAKAARMRRTIRVMTKVEAPFCSTLRRTSSRKLELKIINPELSRTRLESQW